MTNAKPVQKDPLFKRRLGARAIDSLIVYLFGFPFGLWLYAQLYVFEKANGLIQSEEVGGGILWAACTLASLGISHCVYEGVLTGLTGKTIGKALMRLRVVNAADGGKVTFSQSFRRAFAVLGRGMLWYIVYPALLIFTALWASRRGATQPWDERTGTRVTAD